MSVFLDAGYRSAWNLGAFLLAPKRMASPLLAKRFWGTLSGAQNIFCLGQL